MELKGILSGKQVGISLHLILLCTGITLKMQTASLHANCQALTFMITCLNIVFQIDALSAEYLVLLTPR